LKSTAKPDLLRALPSVDELLRSPELRELVAREGHAAVADAAREVLARLRDEVQADSLDSSSLKLARGGINEAIERELRRRVAYSLRPVINATGVILHTNLGRAPLGAAIIDHIREVATTYSNLEFDVDAGERGKRDVHIQRLFASLFGDATERSTVVVNNNAAAVLLTLNSLAEGGEVIASRGELVEIGGSFRIPDVMAKSGAVLREIGTTNRTRIADYERAINERTRLLLRVHRSNFEIVGFTEQPSLVDLTALGRKHNIPVVEDLGSGALFDLRALGIHGETTVAESLAAGVDVVTYSGDKLLGGPQAGLVTGRTELVSRIRSNPLFRALRVDKLTYAALEATLLAYVRKDYDGVPALRFMTTPVDELRRRAGVIVEKLSSEKRLKCELVATESLIGGGAAPAAILPSFAVAVSTSAQSADELATALRRSVHTIIGRVEDGRVLLDLRTVFPEQDAALVAALVNSSGPA
jgi:L-seryl-tRNA(Ser) seleniumtransferase